MMFKVFVKKKNGVENQDFVSSQTYFWQQTLEMLHYHLIGFSSQGKMVIVAFRHSPFLNVNTCVLQIRQELLLDWGHNVLKCD